MNPEVQDIKVIPHRWVIETTYNAQTFIPTSKGFCKHCGTIRPFPNGLDNLYKHLRNPNVIQPFEFKQNFLFFTLNFSIA